MSGNEDQSKAGPDLPGRIMSLEQKYRGIQGRVSAIEMRLSPSAGDEEGLEFIACSDGEEPSVDRDAIQKRMALIEKQVSELKGGGETKNHVVMHTIDITALLTGIGLMGLGIIIWLNGYDLLRNPLLPIGCGAFMLSLSAIRYAYR